MLVETLHLRRFLPQQAETVVEWVEDARELFWLAPSTQAPLTPEKVVSWTVGRDNPYLLCEGDRRTPIGYAELNPLRCRTSHLWIGHVIIAPGFRGRGLGTLFVRLLLEHAFDRLKADTVSLIVFPDNRPAIRCYRSAGFKLRGEQIHRFGRPARPYRMLHLVSARLASAEAH